METLGVAGAVLASSGPLFSGEALAPLVEARDADVFAATELTDTHCALRGFLDQCLPLRAAASGAVLGRAHGSLPQGRWVIAPVSD